MVVATVLGVLTGVLTYRTEWAGNLAITMTASILTVLSLALLGLLVPVVGLGVAPPSSRRRCTDCCRWS